MGKMNKRIIALVVILAVIMCHVPIVLAKDEPSIQGAISDTANFLYNQNKSPQVGSIGGEWVIIGLARSGETIPSSYFEQYYQTVEKYVKKHEGQLHDKKYTEYSRVILALTAIGKDPAQVAGYNLLTPLGDFEQTIWQGINGPIWALIALDSGHYEMPINLSASKQASRQLYIDEILSRQLDNGGFSLFGGEDEQTKKQIAADPDITAMALQALSPYQEQPKVKQAIERALNCLSKMQNSTGGLPAGVLLIQKAVGKSLLHSVSWGYL